SEPAEAGAPTPIRRNGPSARHGPLIAELLLAGGRNVAREGERYSPPLANTADPAVPDAGALARLGYALLEECGDFSLREARLAALDPHDEDVAGAAGGPQDRHGDSGQQQARQEVFHGSPSSEARASVRGDRVVLSPYSTSEMRPVNRKSTGKSG